MRHLLAALVLSVTACSPTEPPARCTPGAQVACACPGGGSGAQVCAADGASYSACACGVGDAGADAAVDAARADVVDAAGTPRDVPPRPADPQCADNLTRRDWCGTDGGGMCVDTMTDPNNCGGCRRTCMGTFSECFGGICFVPLDAGVADATR